MLELPRLLWRAVYCQYPAVRCFKLFYSMLFSMLQLSGFGCPPRDQEVVVRIPQQGHVKENQLHGLDGDDVERYVRYVIVLCQVHHVSRTEAKGV